MQYVYAIGDTYEGEWCNNSICGNGRYMHAMQGDVYTGEFRDKAMHGSGM